MDQNPYKAPEAGIEPAPAQPRPIRTAVKSGAWIGAIIMLSLFAIPAFFVVKEILSGRMLPQDQLYIGHALAVVLAGSLAGSAVGAALGALFQAIANAVIRRGSKKTPPSNQDTTRPQRNVQSMPGEG